jgi:RND family efflux transporter MFP subunit
MPIVEWDEFTGRFAAIESVNVRARVSGYLEETLFKEGQDVHAGDVLAVIDRRPFVSEVNRNSANLKASEALLTQANAAVNQAESTSKRSEIHRDLTIKEFNRQTSLRRQNATAQQDFEIAEAELAQAEADVAVAASGVESAKSAVAGAEAAISVAKANLELAELNLQYTKIRSPIDGRISRRYVTDGNLISGGSNDATLITTIVSINPIHCYFDADEQTYLKYTRLSSEGKRRSSRDVRNPVYLAVADELGIFPHVGHMDFVENQIDVHTGTIRGRAIFPNDDLKLTPGLFARVRLPGSPRYDAILIPDKAVGTDQAEKFVLIVNHENKIERRLITLGPLSHGLRIIRKGLDGSERVVIAGQQRARPGAEVSFTEEQAKPGPEPLPDEYQPVPEDKWLTPKRKPAANVNVPVSDPAQNPIDGNTSRSLMRDGGES